MDTVGEVERVSCGTMLVVVGGAECGLLMYLICVYLCSSVVNYQKPLLLQRV